LNQIEPNKREIGGACCFCDKPFSVVGRSSEHVMPQWLLAKMGILKAEKHTSVTTSIDKQVVTSRTFSAFSRKYNRVCQACNNGWMSDLEDTAQKIIERISTQAHCELSLIDCFNMSAWAYKTFALLNLTAGSERQELIRTDDLHALYKSHQPEGEIELCLSLAAKIPPSKLRVFMPAVRYGAKKGRPFKDQIDISKCFMGVLQVNLLLFTFVYKYPCETWVTQCDSRLKGESMLWPAFDTAIVSKESLPVMSEPESIRHSFVLEDNEL
jgi:hypothetical protein